MLKCDDAKDFAERFLSLAVEFDSFVNHAIEQEKKDNVSYTLLSRIIHDTNLNQSLSRQKVFQSGHIINPELSKLQKENCTNSNLEENVQKKVSIEYKDGTFRVVRKSGLMQYRFMYNKKQESVFGYTKEECWNRRFEFDPAKKKVCSQRTKVSIATLPSHISDILKNPELKRLYSAKLIELLVPVIPISDMGETTIYKDWAIRWIQSKLNTIEPEYASAIASYLINDIFPVFGKRRLKDFAMLDLQDFINGIPKPNKRTKIAAVLSESIRMAAANRLIGHNPYEGLKVNKEEYEFKGALKHREQMMIFCSLNLSGKAKLLVLGILMLLTGLRPGEALSLTATSFDQERKEIVVKKSFSRKRKQNKKTKTAAGDRRVPYEDLLMIFLNPYLNTDDRIFGEFTNDYVCKYFSKQFEIAGIEGTAYMFRHSFITNCYELGVPPYVVQRWAGHSKIEQADTYLALRQAKDFIETPVVKYMRALKARVIVE